MSFAKDAKATPTYFRARTWALCGHATSSGDTTMRKNLLMPGILVTPWWVFTVLLFGELQPGYSHLYHAASELGAFGASHPLAMNMLCFFLTGACVALAGLGFVNYLQSRQESRAAG